MFPPILITPFQQPTRRWLSKGGRNGSPIPAALILAAFHVFSFPLAALTAEKAGSSDAPACSIVSRWETAQEFHMEHCMPHPSSLRARPCVVRAIRQPANSTGPARSSVFPTGCIERKCSLYDLRMIWIDFQHRSVIQHDECVHRLPFVEPTTPEPQRTKVMCAVAGLPQNTP